MIVRCALLLSLAFGTAHAQTKWDMPTPYSDGEFHTRNVKTFVEDVKKATGGKLEIVVHSNGSLIKHPDMLRAVSTGQVNIAEFLLGQFGNEDPVFAADNVPFVAAGLRQRLEVLPGAEAGAREEAAGARPAAALLGGLARPGLLYQGAAEERRRPEGHRSSAPTARSPRASPSCSARARR